MHRSKIIALAIGLAVVLGAFWVPGIAGASTTTGLPAPSNLVATAGSHQASFSWTPAPDTAIYGPNTYTVTCSPNGSATTSNFGQASPSSIVMTGLTNGVTYTCSVVANDSAVSSENVTTPSAPSNTVTVTPVPTAYPTGTPSPARSCTSTFAPGATTGIASDVNGGYWLLSNSDVVSACGGAPLFAPNSPGFPFASMIVPTSDGEGYVTVDEGLSAAGNAVPIVNALGPTGTPLGVTILPTIDRHGYLRVTATGAVYVYGDAHAYGSMAGIALNKPVVGASSTPHQHGYWMVAGDGGIFAFGSARFYGSMGAVRLNKPIIAMTTDPTTGGYWMVASDGGVFSFHAPFYGSLGGHPPASPIVGFASTPSGNGYWMVDANGQVFAFGAATNDGSAD